MATSQHTDLFEILIEAAKSHVISQGELAARVGIRQETLSRAKKHPAISLKTFLDLVRVAGLRVQLVPDHPVAEQITSGTLFPGSNSGP